MDLSASMGWCRSTDKAVFICVTVHVYWCMYMYMYVASLDLSPGQSKLVIVACRKKWEWPGDEARASF